MEKIKGFKTIGVFVLSGLVYFLGWDQLTQYLSPKTIAILTSVLGLGLRFITNTPVFQKDEKAV